MILFGVHVYLTHCSEMIQFEGKSTKQLMIIISFRSTGGEFYTTEQPECATWAAPSVDSGCKLDVSTGVGGKG